LEAVGAENSSNNNYVLQTEFSTNVYTYQISIYSNDKTYKASFPAKHVVSISPRTTF
jgi:hypothetical protein